MDKNCKGLSIVECNRRKTCNYAKGTKNSYCRSRKNKQKQMKQNKSSSSKEIYGVNPMRMKMNKHSPELRYSNIYSNSKSLKSINNPKKLKQKK
jgi:hypothetical protein